MRATRSELASGILRTHERMFRREFRLMPTMIRAVAEGDTARAALVGGFFDQLARSLRHEQLAGRLDRVEVLLPRWWHTADTETRDQLADVIAQASTALDDHLTWDALRTYEQQAFPMNTTGFVFIGALLEDATPAERAAFLKLLPMPVRLAWHLVGRHIHRRAVHRLRGHLLR